MMTRLLSRVTCYAHRFIYRLNFFLKLLGLHFDLLISIIINTVVRRVANDFSLLSFLIDATNVCPACTEEDVRLHKPWILTAT